jgi:hypothetical protein
MQSSFLYVLYCGSTPALRLLGYYVKKPFPFFLTPLAQRRTDLLRKLNAVWNISRLRARLGALPQVPGRFLKKATQKLS